MSIMNHDVNYFTPINIVSWYYLHPTDIFINSDNKYKKTKINLNCIAKKCKDIYGEFVINYSNNVGDDSLYLLLHYNLSHRLIYY